MPSDRSESAKRAYQRRSVAMCPTCDGKGTILSKSAKTRAKQGGIARYLKSLEPGEMSMSEMGQRGGRPCALTLADLEAGGKRRYAASSTGLQVHPSNQEGG